MSRGSTALRAGIALLDRGCKHPARRNAIVRRLMVESSPPGFRHNNDNGIDTKGISKIVMIALGVHRGCGKSSNR